MELKKCPRCYTDVCVNGLWYHYDHLGTTAYCLRGGTSPEVQLEHVPQTEEELISMLESITPPR